MDFVVVRENTEGEYSQIGGHLKKDTPDEVALVNGVYTWKGCERACRRAFELARKGATARGRTGRPKVTLVDKANAIRPHDIWTRALVGPPGPARITPRLGDGGEVIEGEGVVSAGDGRSTMVPVGPAEQSPGRERVPCPVLRAINQTPPGRLPPRA